MTQEEIHDFFARELAKLDDAVELLSQLGEGVSSQKVGLKYHPVVKLLINALTTTIVINLYRFVDKSNLSLKNLQGIDRRKIEELESMLQPNWTTYRHTRAAHLSAVLVHDDNFPTITRKGIGDVRLICKGIRDLLNDVANERRYSGYPVPGWVALDDSICDFMESLER